MINKLCVFIITAILFSGCTKPVQKTSAKLKLNLAKIVNFSSGIGSGGAILFGKSSSGQEFGKFITSTEENLDLPNGNWQFYAVMWEKVTDNFDGKAYCGISSQNLNGQAISISLSLNNANCANAIFAGADGYVDAGENKFSKIWLEECDDLNEASAISCRLFNSGSAVSYRYVFKSFNKSPAGAYSYSGDATYSKCKGTNTGGVLEQDMKLNFPTSNSGMPFVISVEMFLSSSNCGVTPEVKGVYTHTFDKGLGVGTPTNKIVKSGTDYCPTSAAVTESICNDYSGRYGGTCFSVPQSTYMFSAVNCASGTTPLTDKNIKHLVAIPKSFLCRFNDSINTGADAFPGGNGSYKRPYKICNEWQMNQIGEEDSILSSANHYKLMNDLDMNLVTLGVYPAIHCAVESNIDDVTNLNPVDGFLCGPGSMGYYGTFNGNNKTIHNARILAKDVDTLGFVREMQSSAMIRDLNFSNLSVRGGTKIGGVVGANTHGKIINVNVNRGDIEADTQNVGAATGFSCNLSASDSEIINVHVSNVVVRGQNDVGGLVGNNCGLIKQSSFSGIIRAENPPPGSTYAGGIAAGNDGVIEQSFSEGYIGGRTTYMGGVVAANTGTMTDIYSTMALANTDNSPGTFYAGGIAARNEMGAAITNCFSDTRKYYEGGGTFNYSPSIQADVGATSNCFTPSYANLRDPTWLGPNFLSAVTDSSKWAVAAFDKTLPRLAWETRECHSSLNSLSVPAQAGLTPPRGQTADNPIIICNSDQFLGMSARPNGEFYRLAEDLNISNWTAPAGLVDGVTTFNGNFDGDNHAIYGLYVDIYNAQDNIGIFKDITLTGKVHHVNFFANRLYKSLVDTVNQVGIVANVNSGEISNVKAYASSISANNFVGTIAANNAGSILDVSVKDAKIIAVHDAGGVAGNNNGWIVRTSSSLNIGAISSSSYYALAGIAGTNNGYLEQTRADGSLIFTEISGTQPAKVGGLVGFNTGDITNSYTGSHMRIELADAVGFGGLVGEMSGVTSKIENSFNLAKMYFTQAEFDLTADLDIDPAAPETRSVGPVVGTIGSGNVINSKYYEHFMLIGDGASDSISSCTSNIILSTGARTVNGLFSSPDLLGPLSYTYVSANTITPSPLYTCDDPGTYLDFYKGYNNFDEHGDLLNASDFLTPASFAGFDLAVGNTPAVMNYHFSMMNGFGIPSGTPVWVLEAGEDHPYLLQLEH